MGRRLHIALSECAANLLSQYRQDQFFEPRILAHPYGRAPCRMRERQYARKVFFEAADAVGQRQLAGFGKIMRLSISSNKERQAIAWQRGKNSVMPLRCAFRARWLVAAARLSRITEAHRHESDLGGIVHLCF